jgi:hypothetical protein
LGRESGDRIKGCDGACIHAVGSLGHKRCAPIAGIAECTPNALASYEAAQTTERFARQATITGFPRKSGLSRCSTDA